LGNCFIEFIDGASRWCGLSLSFVSMKLVLVIIHLVKGVGPNQCDEEDKKFLEVPYMSLCKYFLESCNQGSSEEPWVR